MSGKGIIIVILGFYTTFMMVGYNLNIVSVNAVDNMVDYYEETVAKNIAMTGANMAANQIFLNNDWDIGISNDGPVALILTRQKLPVIDREKEFNPDDIDKGAYIVSKEIGSNLNW